MCGACGPRTVFPARHDIFYLVGLHLSGASHIFVPVASMSKRIQQPPGTLDSEAAAKALGLSYDKLMRLVRAGYVRPTGYTGRPRTPAWWSKNDIARAETAVDLARLDLTDHQIVEILDTYKSIFDDGYRPTGTIMHKLTKDGKTWARNLCLWHPERDLVTGKKNHQGRELVTIEYLHIPIDEFTPVKWDFSKPAYKQIRGAKPPKRPAKGGRK